MSSTDEGFGEVYSTPPPSHWQTRAVIAAILLTLVVLQFYLEVL